MLRVSVFITGISVQEVTCGAWRVRGQVDEHTQTIACAAVEAGYIVKHGLREHTRTTFIRRAARAFPLKGQVEEVRKSAVHDVLCGLEL
jgi:hypothetical protein